MVHRPRFDKTRSHVAARGFTFAGVEYAKGDPFPDPDKAPVSVRLIERQFEARRINQLADATQSTVQMTGPTGSHIYEITAPWLDTPIKVRGKKKAQQAYEEISEEGAPLGWIAGGSEVEIEPDGDVFYVNAPWLQAPEEFADAAAARARQLELHKAGEPVVSEPATIEPVEGEAAMVLVSVNEDDTIFTLSAPWLEQDEEFITAEAAEARQLEVREAGSPEGWEPKSEEPVLDAPADHSALVKMGHTGGGWYEIAAPWLEDPDRLKGKDAAQARYDEIVSAGPPEGWSPAKD